MKSAFPTLLLAFFSFFFPEEVNGKKNKDASNNKSKHIYFVKLVLLAGQIIKTILITHFSLSPRKQPFLLALKFAAADVSSRNVLSGEE